MKLNLTKMKFKYLEITCCVTFKKSIQKRLKNEEKKLYFVSIMIPWNVCKYFILFLINVVNRIWLLFI